MSTAIRVDVEKWKALVSKGGAEAARDLAIAKAVTTEIKVVGDEGDRVLETVASTQAVDRDKDTVNPAGWQLGNFSKNGPILWAHDASQLPVAKSVQAWMDAAALRCKMQFPTAEVYGFADTVYQLAKGGYLNAVSVGFLPLKWIINEERGFFAIDFQEQELLEISIVPIPSNPEALIQARSVGKIDLEPVITWAEKVLDGAKGAGLWVPVPREGVERARKAMLGDPASIILPPGYQLTRTKVGDVEQLRIEPIETRAAGVEGDASSPVSISAPVGAPEVKRGRTLSAANESKLRTAHKEIGEVLSQVESAPEEDAAPNSTTKSDNMGPDDCPRCSGNGKVDGADCPSCSGTGHKSADACGTCDGSGECATCHGTGKVDDHDCGPCKGSGECASCDGSGKKAAPPVPEAPKAATVPDGLGKMLDELTKMVGSPAPIVADAPAPFQLDEGRIARSIASVIDAQLIAPLNGRVS